MDPAIQSTEIRSVRGLLLLIFLVIIFGGVFYAYKKDLFPSFSRESVVSEFSGTLYLGLLPNPPEKNPFSIYSFELGSGMLKKVLGGYDQNYATGSFSPSEQKIAFSVVSSDGEGKFISSIFTSLKNGAEKKLVATSDTLYLESPRWSTDEALIVFEAISRGNQVEGKKTEVFVVSSEKESLSLPSPIGEGGHPRFLPSGDIVAVATDGGLNLFSAKESWKRTKVWDTGAFFDVFPGNSLLAISEPSTNILEILRVSSWDPFIAEVVGSFSATAFWPSFSEDGNSIAFIEAVSQDFNDSKYFVSILDIPSGRTGSVFNLDGFYKNSLYLNDWVE